MTEPGTAGTSTRPAEGATRGRARKRGTAAGTAEGDAGEAARDAEEAAAGSTTVDDVALEAGGKLLDSARTTLTTSRVSWLRAGFFAGLGLAGAYALALAVRSMQ